MKQTPLFGILILSLLILSACAPSVGNANPATSPDPTLTPQTAPTLITSNFPSLVWLPLFHSSEWHEDKVLTIRNGQGAFEPAPVDIGLFWDYTSLTGRIAFASHFWQADASGITSVSDLWVHDYDSGKSEMWWTDHIVRAAWSPTVDPNTSRQYLAASLDDGSLALFTGPNEFRTLSPDVSSNFSWSPDGRWLAFLENEGGLFMVSVDDGQSSQLTKVVTNNVDGMGWVGDKPVWALENQSIIYTKAPFEIARLDDSEAFTPRTVDGKLPQGERAFNMLWSPEKRMLVVETEDMNIPKVWIYELSADLKTIINSDSFERIETEPVAGWWVPGESILLRNGEVWSIPEKAVLFTIQ